MNLGGSGGGGGRGSGVFDIDMLKRAKRLTASHTPMMGVPNFGDAALYICTPGQSQIFVDNGWSKQDLREFYAENCRSNPREWFPTYPDDIREDILKTAFAMAPIWMRSGASVPIFRRAEDIWIVVVGGAAPRRLFTSASHHGGHPAVIKQITLVDGTPAKSVKDFKRN